MKFSEPLVKGILIKRYKRFLADIQLSDGMTLTAYCPNTGRMLGCAHPGSPVYLSKNPAPSRKYLYTLEMVDVQSSYVGVNTILANCLVEEALRKKKIRKVQKYSEISRETSVDEGRIDFLLSQGEEKCYLEVKNVTMKEKDTAYFPDAVTQRGSKHLRILQRLRSNGHRAVILYLVQREDCQIFMPADHIDPLYGDTLRCAVQNGVEIMVYGTKINPSEIEITHSLPYRL